MRTVIPSSLPYRPHRLRTGHTRSVGHPQALLWLQHLLLDNDLHTHPDAVLYKQRPNVVGVIPRPPGLDIPPSHVAIKWFGWRGVQHYLLSPLRSAKAMRSYRAACHLLANSLPTPLPIGAAVTRRYGFVQAQVYATEGITDYMTLREYCVKRPDGAQGMAEVMQLAADYTRRMHDSGLWHRDLFLANFLMTGVPGNRRLNLIDLNRARRVPYMPAWLRALDLARMEWAAWQPQFLALYSNGRFPDKRMLTIMRLFRRWRHVRSRLLGVLNPLRRRLGLKT